MKIVLSTSLLICVVMLACVATSGTMRRYRRTTTTSDSDTVKEVVEEETEIKLPKNAKEQSVFSIKDEKGVRAVLPAVYEPAKADSVMNMLTGKSFYLSIAVGVLALGCLVAKKWIPLIPSYAPVGLGGLSVALYVAPVLLDRYSGWLGLGVVGLAAWCVYGYLHNRKLKNSQSPEAEKNDVG